MKKFRGFRLSGSLVRVWRWVRRRRRRRLKPSPYVRLEPYASATLSPLGSTCLHCHRPERTTTVTTKLAGWGRYLSRRFGCGGDGIGRWGGDGGLLLPRGVEEGDESCLLLPRGVEEGDESCLHRRRRRLLRREVGEEAAWRKRPPKGHVAVYVGRKGVESPRRMLVPVVYFNHPLFAELLRGAEEEFGFHHPGGIMIPCPVAEFETVRRQVAAAAGSRRGGFGTP